MPFIENIELTQYHLGSKIVYIHLFDPENSKLWETGILSSFRDDGAIFVRFKGPSGERCPPERLRWYPHFTRKELLSVWRNP